MTTTTVRVRAPWAVALAAAGVLAAGVLPARAKDEGGTLPAAVLEFAKATKPGGRFAMELDASGALVALEAEVPVDALPKAALDLAAKAFPNGKPVGGEREWIAGASYWEVVLDVAGSRVELLVNPDGTEGGREEVVPKAQWPQAILDAADKAVPGGTVEAVELVKGAEAAGRGTEYHVKKDVDGEVQRISVSPEGKVALVLRKMTAEVKIPR